MNDFLKTVKDKYGNDMMPRRGNSGKRIQERFTPSEREQAVKDFYNGPGAKYQDAARDALNQRAVK